MSLSIALAEHGLVPSSLVRVGIRRLLQRRLEQESLRAASEGGTPAAGWLAILARSPIALHTEAANRQHYEVPAAFFERVLGPHLKYSSALWSGGTVTL